MSDKIDIESVVLESEKVEEKKEEIIGEKKEEIIEEKKEEIKEIIEEIKEEIPDFTNKTIPEIFLYILKQNENNIYCKKIGITISKDVVEIINNIIEKNPELLSDVEKSVKEILKDGKINTNDIPEFILVIQILYERLFNTKNVKLNKSNIIETCSIILKFLIHTLIEERKIELDLSKKNELVDQLDKLIDSCMCLLNFEKVLKPKGCGCSIM